MKKRSLLIACLTVLLAACASKDFREPASRSSGTSSAVQKTYQRSYTDVWNAILSALAEKKYAVAVSKRDSGMIVTDWVMGKSDRLYSGYGDTRIPYTVRFKMTVRLTPSRDGVKATVKNEEQYYTDAITAGTDFNGSLYQWLPTSSSGTKENALLAAVKEQLDATAPAPSSKEKK